jgi:PiT family inorganic phosphate transporter
MEFNHLVVWFTEHSSHALIGGLIGSGLMKGGFNILVWKGIIKTSSFIIISPVIGLMLGFTLMIVVLNLSRHSNITKSNAILKNCNCCPQPFTASVMV